jgi:hypothetical protein
MYKGLSMKFLKTKLAAIGFALTASMSVIGMPKSEVNIELIDKTPIDTAQDVVSYLSTHKNKLTGYLPEGHRIDISIINIVIPDSVRRKSGHKITVSNTQSDAIAYRYGSSRTLDIPGGYLRTKPYRLLKIWEASLRQQIDKI